ncbi:hypothetical protein [Oryza sativa Japonica Group]|uniref:Uncharacterized protein n=1 Tax=Oryza sativa subsp. japonica TaxID=39947 RepID=Q8S0G2_ORYSJ|nr:hypothetical protein [Oryza sativa Japonica Group]
MCGPYELWAHVYYDLVSLAKVELIYKASSLQPYHSRVNPFTRSEDESHAPLNTILRRSPQPHPRSRSPALAPPSSKHAPLKAATFLPLAYRPHP